MEGVYACPAVPARFQRSGSLINGFGSSTCLVLAIVCDNNRFHRVTYLCFMCHKHTTDFQTRGKRRDLSALLKVVRIRSIRNDNYGNNCGCAHRAQVFEALLGRLPSSDFMPRSFFNCAHASMLIACTFWLFLLPMFLNPSNSRLYFCLASPTLEEVKGSPEMSATYDEKEVYVVLQPQAMHGLACQTTLLQ